MLRFSIIAAGHMRTESKIFVQLSFCDSQLVLIVSGVSSTTKAVNLPVASQPESEYSQANIVLT